jgi:hypothetical protein
VPALDVAPERTSHPGGVAGSGSERATGLSVPLPPSPARGEGGAS